MRNIFGPGYSASKTAVNAMSVATAIECEGVLARVHEDQPHRLSTDTVEQGASEAVRLAQIGPDGPSGTFSHATMGILPW